MSLKEKHGSSDENRQNGRPRRSLGGNIYLKPLLEKELVYRMYKEFSEVIKKKTSNPWKQQLKQQK